MIALHSRGAFAHHWKMRNPIIAALDVPTKDRAMALVEKLSPVIPTFKIGSELFASAGPEIVRNLRTRGLSVFLDLKFHDIPNTVKNAVAAATRLGVQMLTVHCAGGLEMLKAAEAAAQETAKSLAHEPPLVLGVTVLTSMDGPALEQVGVTGAVEGQVERLAKLAVAAGLRGLVCSPLELPMLRKLLPPTVQLVTPGIRGPGDPTGDQKRTMTAREAIAGGANWLVIGRPICAAPDPRAAAERILASVQVES
jgi:orotidine-5'-phosphate decarboxylase